uniref:Small ribosomal subunit protein uS4c n=1 Tax=Aegilops tauschii subsp. strangulata TaxID=200361 RepID=A0A452Y9V9_AEGTS
MSRYLGPRLKKYAVGELYQDSLEKHLNLKVILKKINSRKKEQYRIRLQEKQKLRFHYGLTERLLLRYVHIAGKARSTGQVLLQLLEMRLDNILFRLGMASTIPGARQLVNHRHILVNGRIVNIPSFHCKPQDIITTKDNQRSKGLVQNYIASSDPGKLPKHLVIDTLEYKGLVNKILDRKWVGLKINELLVVEYYSRQT